MERSVFVKTKADKIALNAVLSGKWLVSVGLPTHVKLPPHTQSCFNFGNLPADS